MDTLEKTETKEEVVPLQLNCSHELLLGEQAHMMNIVAQHIIEEDQEIEVSEVGIDARSITEKISQ